MTTKVRRTLLVVAPVSIVICLVAFLTARATKQAGTPGRVQALRGEADGLIEEKRYAEGVSEQR